MIYDDFARMGLYKDAVPYLDELETELKSLDLSAVPAGTYYTKKSGIKYMVQEYTTVKEKKAEVHASFADVQLLVDGSERFTACRALNELPEGFDKEGDIGFLEAEDGVDFPLRKNVFIIVFPGEPHTPGLALGKCMAVRKIVAKIPFAR